MCFEALTGVPHELPAIQTGSRAKHGGYTTDEIAGGYGGDSCFLGYALVLLDALP